MPSTKNRIIVACAGSGKTTRLVNEALAMPEARIAFITYTNNNAKMIIDRFGALNSGVPSHVEVMTWFSFLLRECARPYQRSGYTDSRIESVYFVNQRSALRVPETDTRRYYFAQGQFIYSDKLSQFVAKCEGASSQRVTNRLQEIYTDIFIDEFQDLAGWDFEVIETLLKSKVRITLMGDPRQHIYSTNPSPKNSQFLGMNVLNLLSKWEANGLCTIEKPMNQTHRCSTPICEFVNKMWPEMEPMTMATSCYVKQHGVILVATEHVEPYLREVSPQILRYDKRVFTYGREGMNFGESKGLEFNHVLIIPTKPIQQFLATGELKHIEASKHKLHVAVTRAVHSVGFLYDGESPLVKTKYEPL